MRTIPLTQGTSYMPENKKWRARLTNNKRQISLGCFNTQIEAAMAYDIGAKKYHGEFAWLNFP